MGDRELLELARRRYPGDPSLALMQFSSDRRRAGLGALDIDRRQRGTNKRICHTKEWRLDGRVYYKSSLDIPELWFYPKCPPAPCLSAFEAEMTVQAQRRTAVRAARVLPIEAHKIQDQAGRREVAYLLWQLRKSIRAAAEIGKSMPDGSGGV